MQGLPAVQNVCRLKVTKLKNRYPNEVKAIAEAMMAAHDRVQEARARDIAAAAADPAAAPTAPAIAEQELATLMSGIVEDLIQKFPDHISSQVARALHAAKPQSAPPPPRAAPAASAGGGASAPSSSSQAAAVIGLPTQQSRFVRPEALAPQTTAAALASANAPPRRVTGAGDFVPEEDPGLPPPHERGVTPAVACAMQLFCSLMCGPNWATSQGIQKARIAGALANRFTEYQLKLAINVLRAGKWLSAGTGRMDFCQLSLAFRTSLDGALHNAKRNALLVGGGVVVEQSLMARLRAARAALPLPRAAVAPPQAALEYVEETVDDLCADVQLATPAAAAAAAAAADDALAGVDLRVSSPDTDVPSELLLVVLPGVVNQTAQLAALPPAHAAAVGRADVEPAAPAWACDVSVTTVEASQPFVPRAARPAVVATGGGAAGAIPETEQAKTTMQLAHAIHADPTFLIGLPTHLTTPLQGLLPYALGMDAEKRKAAEAQCEAHMGDLAAHILGRGRKGGDKQGQGAEQDTAAQARALVVALTVVLQAVRASGAAGLTIAAVQDALARADLAPAAASPGVDLAAPVVAAALRACLIRAVAAYDDTRVIAVEHSQALVVPLTSEQAQRACGGQRQEVLLCAWHKATGAVNREYMNALLQRAILAVERNPGASEDALLSHLVVISPTNARLLLRTMCEQGLISVKMAHAAPKGGRPGLLGGRPRAERVGGLVRHYVPVLGAGLTAMHCELLVPSVPAS